MKLRVRACIAIALFLCARAAAAQAPDFTALDAVVQQELKEAGVPGATVAIVSGGRVIYSRATARQTSKPTPR
jgi:CubicO group peptidase (beta-lactamase class C family)